MFGSMMEPNDYSVENGNAIINGMLINIDNIDFVSPIDEGGNGIVFEAFDRVLERKVAIKFWLPKRRDKRDKIKQAIFEARKIAALRHPNIVNIYHSDQYDHFLFYVIMEFITGMTLKDYLIRQKADINVRYNLWEKIVEALEFAHKQGIYHGDIHLRNIMVEENNIKIIDFGTSIFVRNQNSRHKREIKLLIKLVREMFPEFDLFGLETAKKLTFKPEDILLGCRNLVRIHMAPFFKSFELNEPNDWLRNYKSKSLIYDICIYLSECPIFDLSSIISWLRKIRLDDLYIKMFLDVLKSYILQTINRQNIGVMVPNADENIEIKLQRVNPIWEEAKKYFIEGKLREIGKEV